jgi:hypothetical protein
MSRPSKLTTEAQEQLCALIARGNTRADAAACLGVAGCTLRAWLAAGRKARKEGKRDRFVAFLAAVEKAEAECRKRLVQCVWKASPKNWRAAAYLLGCKSPDDYGPFLHVLREIKKELAELKKSHANPQALPAPGSPPEGQPPPG